MYLCIAIQFNHSIFSSLFLVRHPYPHIHSQNGRTERKHRHIVDLGLTLLAQAFMPLSFWWEAFAIATYLINCLPTLVLSHKSLVQTLFGVNLLQFYHIKVLYKLCLGLSLITTSLKFLVVFVTPILGLIRPTSYNSSPTSTFFF